MDDYQYLLNERLQIVERIKRIYNFSKGALSDVTKQAEFKVRFKSLQSHFSLCEELSSKILKKLVNDEVAKSASKEADIKSEQKLLIEIEDLVVATQVNYHAIFGEENNQAKTAKPVKLPALNLPTFNGEFKLWSSFFDLFNSMVHNNISLSNIEKFQFLTGCLVGEPLNLIKNLPLSNENYSIAYKNLQDKYQNPRLLAMHYWNSILQLPRVVPDTYDALQHLITGLKENIAALAALGLPTQEWGFVLFHHVFTRIDKNLGTLYEDKTSSNELPSFDSLLKFLEDHCSSLAAVESLSPKKSEAGYSKAGSSGDKTKPKVNFRSKPSVFVVSSSSNCPLCNKSHSILNCNIFIGKGPHERYLLVKKHKLCVNCLEPSHGPMGCSSTSRCHECNLKHHVMLHFGNKLCTVNNSPDISCPNAASVSSSVRETQNALLTKGSNNVLLATAQIEVLDASGQFQLVRVLLDTGSQVNIITNNCLAKLGLEPTSLSNAIQGLGQTSVNSLASVSCTIRSRYDHSVRFDLEAILLPQICSNLPLCHLDKTKLEHIQNLSLADTLYNVPGPIDMLLGADIFASIMSSGKITGNRSDPMAINTLFGWVLMGKIPSQGTGSYSFLSVLNSPVDTALKKFWELEEIPEPVSLSSNDLKCEKHFLESHRRDETGRYIVELPFKQFPPILGDSKSTALRRLYSLERKLANDDTLQRAYSEFMQDYLDSGHMSASVPAGDSFYIPHHGVINYNSCNPKLRVVFDGSAGTSNGHSINDNLHVGPKLQKDICTLLMTFRLHKIVFTADIRQMYRQILVCDSHRCYQKVLWRFNRNQSVQEFTLNTVTYGLSSSPYLAIRTLLQLAADEGSSFPRAAEVLKHHIYMDDIIGGCETVDDGIELQNQLIGLLQRGGFELRKWASNEATLLARIPDSHRQTSLSFDDSNIIKILGLRWEPSSDAFSYHVTPVKRECTKRNILSELSRIFDPLGFLAPLSFFAKHLMQYLWTLGIGWDETPPDEVMTRWSQYLHELPKLQFLSIPRHLALDCVECELHGFADASERGYAAVLYLRMHTFSGGHSVVFVTAKSKVAPLQRVSLPRLELCGCLLLANLISFTVKTCQNIPIKQIYAWSDSTVALAWLKSSPHRWKTFVSNRVSKIQDKVGPDCWYHVSTHDNPADCASRGLLPSELISHPLWWNGPVWLTAPKSEWPSSSTSFVVDDSDVTSESRQVSLNVISQHDAIDTLLSKFSSIKKISRVLSYCLRLKTREKNCPLVPTPVENEKALLCLIKYVQYVSFENEIEHLKNGTRLPKSLRKLCPFLDKDGFIRVGGRLREASIPYEAKHPLLLPAKHRLTELLIQDVHIEHLHPGLNAMHCLLSQKYWILSSRKAIYSQISRCIPCFKVNPRVKTPPMGNLPKYRVNQVKAFCHTGIDYAGPVSITLKRMRGAKVFKAYICLFVCMSTKAYHLELASDLTADCFLACFRRFVARRGRCSHIYSDCGTNFQGAYHQMLEYAQCASQELNINWHFNPPSAPHMGGLWESGVKSVKTHLNRVIGTQLLTYEELNTVLTQIEAVLNSRPLMPISSDPNDLEALTPGHFLTLEPLTSPPDFDYTSANLGRLSRWQLIQQINQSFWARWHQEYLHTLQQRAKWLDAPHDFKVGTLVLVKDELKHPLLWKLGRVSQVHPGADGIIRVATVKTVNGEFRRPLVKLAPLPSQ